MNNTTNDATISGAPKPKSAARVAAGQRNGRLAAGKKSPQGRAISAQNAYRHGCYARSFTILPTENRSYFESFAESLRDDLQPNSPRQALLAEQIINYNWLLQRNFRFEEAALSTEILSQHNARPDGQETPATQLATFFAFDALANRNQTLNAIYRHRAQIQRELARITRQFDDLKAKDSSSALGAAHPPLPIFEHDMFLPEIEIPAKSCSRQTTRNSNPDPKQANDQNCNNEGNALRTDSEPITRPRRE